MAAFSRPGFPCRRRAWPPRARVDAGQPAQQGKVEDEDDEGDSEDEGQDFVALVPFLFPTSYFLTTNYFSSARSRQ